MNKNERISAFVQQLGAPAGTHLDARYLGFFTCFNDQQYYEAHDVLEDLWLRSRDEHWLFFKGLIQFAGAFVHLQKQFAHPEHAKHGRRLRPAARLFTLALKNLAPFAPRHLQLDVTAVLCLGESYRDALAAADYERNPWHPDAAPQLALLPS